MNFLLESSKQLMKTPQILVRVVRLERTVSWSQTRRDTNFAIPGYSISAIIPRRGRKSKIFLSVVIPVVKAAFMPLSAIGENPANTSVARLCGVSPCPVPDTATALPNQARYQLRYTRIFNFCHYTTAKRRIKVFGYSSSKKQHQNHHTKKDSAICKVLSLVEVTGFEPAASWSQTKRATICATPRCSVLKAGVSRKTYYTPEGEKMSSIGACKNALTLRCK